MMQMNRSNLGLEAPTCSAVLAERFRLGREIHDTLVQGFASILLHLEAANKLNPDGDDAVGECLTRVRELAKCGLEDARRMLLNLRPRSLEDLSLLDALTELANHFARDSNITCKFSLIGRAYDLPFQIQDELYRLAQEALCNVRKHSRATSAWLSLSYGSSVVMLTIKDNGRGFERNNRSKILGYGLGTMQERIHCLGGRIEINTGFGAGTEISIAVPLQGEIQTESIGEWNGNRLQ